MSAPEAERLARLTLSRLVEPGDPRMTGLVEQLDGRTVLDRLADEGGRTGLGADVAVRAGQVDAVTVLERARRQGLRYVVPGDEEWPAGLGDLASCEPLHQRGGVPLGLWLRGPLRWHELSPTVAIVGSRTATTYGTTLSADVAATVASAGMCVVSGAAYGIDQAAHRGALGVGGATVAVLACGVDRAYPAAHQALLDHLGTHGLVVSEVEPGSAPTRFRFLARNRLIAGLSGGTVIIEAALRSGALNTANWTDRLSRPLMAMPGPVTSAPSQGAHQLVRNGSAQLVTHGSEVLELLGRSGQHLVEVPRAPARRRDRLSARDAQVLEAVPVTRPVPIDSIASTAGVGLYEVHNALIRLAKGGFVEQTDTGWMLTEQARERTG